MNIALHNLYDPGVCAEVHHLRTITSQLVGMQATCSYLREFQDLVWIQLNNYNQRVKDLAQRVVQVEKCMVAAKVQSRVQTELDVLAAAGLFPGVYASYSSQRPRDQIVLATPPRYIPAPPTSLSSLSALMSASHSPSASPTPLPVPCPTLSIFTQSQNPHVTHMLLIEDGRSLNICHSHICRCDDKTDFTPMPASPEACNKCVGYGQHGHYKKNCEQPHMLCSKRKCKVPRMHPFFNKGECVAHYSKV
jgi:hypothetical protein